MNTSRKDRRSKRIPAKHRLMLTILNTSGTAVVKEIVITVEVSRHGARIRGRRPLQTGWKGVLAELSSLRKAPFRVAWQAKASDATGYLDSGVEFLEDAEFWVERFSKPDPEPVPPAKVEQAPVSMEKLLEELSELSAFQGQEKGRVLEGILCGLVEQLEERKIFTRAELVACLRKVGQL